MATILVLHGPNLNLLGRREPETYGSQSLEDINSQMRTAAKVAGVEVDCLQSNDEAALVDRIQSCLDGPERFIIINAAAYTHTSVAIRDALLAVALPYIEVHLSNVHAREPFRQHSYLSDKAVGVICGLGAAGYQAALTAAINHIQQSGHEPTTT